MSGGDTAWVLICSALVLLMTPGLAFFYGGLVREKNAINTIKMSFIALGVIALEWVVVGYSMAYAEGSKLIGGLAWVGLSGVGVLPNADYSETVPHLAFMAFQMMFAIITPALISGAVVGRMKFKAYVLFILCWGVLVYNPVAHWVWGPGGWIAEMGAIDFAGGTVVHITAGVSALVAALVLGPRKKEAKKEERPHNIPLVVLGTGLLWFGWFGFNAGSALAADGVAALSFVTTMIAASAAVVTWVMLQAWQTEKPTAVGACIAAVVGLVAITPGAGFVTPMSAIAIGSIAAAVSYFAMQWMGRTRVDDALDVFACHGLGGATGAILTGVFATTSINAGGANGLLAGNPGLLLAQLISVLVVAAYAAVATAGILYVLKAIVGLRTSPEAEALGIDLVEHAEAAYAHEGGEGFLSRQ